MPPPDPDLTPAQERAVRARLADARHDEPVPDDVAARLDATLAGLVADRDGGPARSEGRVVELRSRRRKVTAGLLAAAAVVVVGGVVGGQVLGGGSSLPTISGSAYSAGGAESTEQLDGGATAEDRSARSDALDGPPAAAPTVAPDRFAADAERLRGLARVSAATRDPAPRDGVLARCRVRADRGRRVRVTYEGRPGVLVYGAPSQGRQQVELHLCGSTAPRRAAEIPAP